MVDGRRSTRGNPVPGYDKYTIARRNRYWEVRDPDGELVCLAVYKRGAKEVVRRMTQSQTAKLEVATAS